MKMKFLIIFSAVFQMLIALGAGAQEASLVPYVTVSGYAEDWIEPDVAVWDITIQQKGKEMRDLKEVNDREYDRVLGIAKSLGVSNEQIIAGRLSIRKEYERDKHHNVKGFSHYVLTRNIKVVQLEIDRFDEFLDQLVIEGDLNANLRYQSTIQDTVRSKLKLQAVESARLKAVAMAEVLGAAVGRPLIISEYPIITDYAQVDRLSMQAGLIQRASPERVHLREQVYIRFNLEGRKD